MSATGLLLLAGLWLLLVGLVWWALLRLWPRPHPYARRSAASLITLALVVLLAGLGVGAFESGTAPPTRDLAVPLPAVTVILAPPLAERAELTFITDPPGALVYLDGRPLGTSPLTASVPRGLAEYVVVADPSLYRPFVGQVMVGEERNLAVWIDRRAAGELSELARVRENSFLVVSDVLEANVIHGTVRNDSSHDYPAVFISYLLYQGGALVGATHALVPELGAGEERRFETLPIGPGVTRYVLLELVELVP